MYRDYEDARALAKQLSALTARMAKCTDDDERYRLHLEIEEVKDRIRFAWDDEENG